jgi:hypothetical protein
MAPQHAANPARSNEDLNLAVLRRHWPTIASILHIAAYCVVYNFNKETTAWEKADIDGTLFIVNHVTDTDGEERYSANILNRRRLENFSYELRDPQDVQMDAEFIMLNEGDDDHQRVHGLWVFSEPPPNSTAHAHEVTGQVIKSFAQRAADMREHPAEAQHNGDHHHEDPAPAVQEVDESEGHEAADGVPMGRQVSLHEILDVQREKDSSWSVHNHRGGQGSVQQAQAPPQPSLLSLFTSNPDTDFFQTQTPPRRSPKVRSEGPAVPSTGSRPIDLGDLFKAASNHMG